MIKLFKFLFVVGILLISLIIAPVTNVYAISIPAEINKQFTPIFIDSGGISVLRVSIFNPNTFQLTNASWSDNLIGVQPGLSIANPAGINNTCGGVVVAVPGTTALSLSGGTVPAQVVATPGECYVEVNVTSTTPGNLINTIPTNNLVSTGNDGGTPVAVTNTTPASATLTVVAVTPPSVSKAFTPSNTMWVGENRTLTITIRNNDINTPLTQVSITDTLPVGVTVSGVPASPQCGGGIVTSTAGSVTLTGGTIPGNATCNIVLNVTSATQGIYNNTIPAGPAGPGSIRTQQGVTNAAAATAPLNVQAIGVLKAFSTTPIAAGGVSTVTLTLQNPTGVAYTGAAFTDTLPAGLLVSGTPASPQCGGTITSTAGSVTLAGGTIPPSATPPLPLGTCTITFQVTTPANAPSTGAPGLANTIPVGGLTTTQGVSNPAAVSANIVIQAGLTVLKAFAPASFTVGGTSTVTVTLRNHTGAPFTGVNLTDTLPAGLTITGTPASPQCGGTITNTATAVTLAGGTIPAGTVAAPGTCTMVFQVTSAVAGTYTNTIPINNVTNDQGVGNLTQTNSNNLTVVNAGGPVTVAKAFQTSPILPGATSRLRITITAPTDIGVTGLAISDTLPGDLVIVGNPPAPANPVTTCGGVLTAGIGTQSIQLTGGAIAAASGTCTITVYVTTNTPGVYPNTIPASNVTTAQGRTNTAPSNTANLTVSSLSMGKAFFPPTVNPNGFSRLTITLTNTATSALVNVAITDALTTMGGVAPGSGVFVAPTPNAATTCTGGVITATAGTQTISMAGGSVPAQVGAVPGVCTISVDVQGRGATATRTNTIPPANLVGTVQSTGVVINPVAQAQAVLNIAPLTIGVVKGFNPVLVYGGASSTMSVQLVNPNNAVLTGITFTDDMNLLLPGMIIANPANLNVGTCGGVLTGNPGDTSFSFSGGVLAANTNCILTLRVSMNINGNRTNRIPAGAVTTFNGVSSPDPAEASLTNLPGASVSKVFGPNPVLAGSSSTLTITIQNTSAIPLSGMGLTDGLPGALPIGLEIANPTNLTNTCNGTVTAVPGSQTIQLVGGTLGGNLSCIISVSVRSTIPGSYLNTIPTGALSNAEGATNNLPATDTLVVTPPFFSLGNRVWFDTDNSGTLNGTENGANGVIVEVYAADGAGNPTGAVLGTQTTANGGYYRFDNLSAGDYVVVIPATQFGAGGVLDGYWSSSTTVNGTGVVSETAAPDADNDIDSDDNGTLKTGGAFNGAVISSAVTLGPSNTEPINDADADATNPPGEAVNSQSNRSVDFGFYRAELSNQIFTDVNNNGTFDAGDNALAGATVQLFASNGTTEINVGPDGILGTADDAAGGITTVVGGTYLFSGLPQGDYVVKVTPPAGYASTVDTANNGDTTNPNNNINNNDNGVGTAPGQAVSNTITLAPGSLGAAVNNVVTNATGTTTNPTMDFGFIPIPFSLGNRVWFDTNNSGTINGAESGVNGVTVQVYAADGTGNPTGAALGTQTTANGGYYRFDNLLAGDYVVVIPASQFGAGGVLDGYWSSSTTLNGTGLVNETAAPDADNDVDNDDNGTLQTAGAFNGAIISSAVTLGPINTEPINDVDADVTNPPGEAANNQSNRTVDFGFYRAELSNQVFLDVNNNGTFDAGDTGLAGAIVRLYASNGTTEINIGPDGILGTADDAAGGVTTGAAGTYLFSGLPQGSYVVKVTPPVDHASTVDTASAADTTNPNGNIDNNDNGVGIGAGQVSSNVIPLTPGNAGAALNNIVSNATGTTSNPTMDFGFIQAPGFSLGNRVWFDTDNSGTINGTESGVDGVTVQVFAADGAGNPTGAVLGTQTTANGGYYRFDNLLAGDYVVVIPTTQFGAGGVLDGYWSSNTTLNGTGVVGETAAPDTDNDIDNDDNGTFQTAGAFNGAVISSAVTLGPSNTEPTTDADADATNPPGEAVNNQSNRTIDFGFYRAELSNQIFADANTNGTFDAGDIGLPGATVQLYSSNGTTEINVGPDGILGTADDAAGGITTVVGGTYLFSGLPQGDYIVKVTPPIGSTSTVDTANNGDTVNPNNNIDNNDNGVGTAPGQVASNTVALTPGNVGGAANNVITNATGTTTNPTMDFGFIPIPFSLGNRVWFDTDNSGTINGTESGVDGVTVQVYAADITGNPTGAVLGTQTTANGGYYRFDNLVAGDYVVVIPATQFGAGGVLDGYWSSSTTLNGTGVVSETAAPDADNDIDNDDNGTLQTAGAFNGAVISKAVTLGPTSVEPITDADADATNPPGESANNQSNRTVDFGFYRAALSNQVFTDVNNNGTFDAGDTALAGATVQLYASNGTTEINVGPDGILGTADDAAGGVTTGAGGTYLFSGLPQGGYIVKVTPPVNHASTVDTASAADTTNPNTNIDNNDNGVGIGGGQASSKVVAVTPGNAGAAGNNVITNANGTTTNPTLDFGFIPISTYSLGNRVWFDTDNSGTINGTESGVNGVTVEVYAADAAGNPTGAVLGTQTTANGGYYRFDNLFAGDYVVVIPASQFGSGGVLDGYWSSGTMLSGTGLVSETAAPDADNDIDSDDNGILRTSGTFNGAVISSAVTLGPGITEPTTDADADATNPPGESANNQSNRTVDFGFYRAALSNQVFFDVNNNGTFDVADTALVGATVQLYASNGTTEIRVGPDGILGTADDGVGGVTTGAGGIYLFSGLPQGTYVVKVNLPLGYASTVDTADAADSAGPDTNTDNNDNGVGMGVGQAASNPVTLTPGSAGVAANSVVTNANGTTTNPTLDFGFVRPNGMAKNLIDTNESFTTGNNVAIGEIVTYEVTIDLAAGAALANVTVTDRMDKGLAFVDCLSVNLGGVNITAAACPPAVSAITNPGDSAANPANPGRQVLFNIGNIPGPAAATTLVIQYRAIVLDVIENQKGVTLNNSATWAWTGGSVTTSAPNVTIIEPDLSIRKSAAPAAAVAVGTPIFFTITIAHTASSNTDAFDVLVDDILPAGLDYIPCTLSYTGLAPTTSPVSCNPATSLSFAWDSFPLGQTATISFNGRLNGTASSATNTASVAWSSLPIDTVAGVPVQLSTHNVTSTERLFDPNDPVNVYQVSASVTINPPAVPAADADLPDTLPLTGFAPNVITKLPPQSEEKHYTATDVWMEIPSLGVSTPIVGVPLVDGDWDLSWLDKQAGWLNGTAFPGWAGNSVLTGHVYLSNGKPGPFVDLGKLKWGDKIIVHAYGSVYTYEVRENRTVGPTNTSVLAHEDDSWLTLITCKTYKESTNTYASRTAVRAALVSVKLETTPKSAR